MHMHLKEITILGDMISAVDQTLSMTALMKLSYFFGLKALLDGKKLEVSVSALLPLALQNIFPHEKA